MASASSMETKEEKQLRIKTGVVRRLAKEMSAYEHEATEQKKKIEGMVAAGKDEYDIKKQNEVLAETEMMVPDTAKRLSAAVDGLGDYIDANADALSGAAGLAGARELLASLSATDAAGAGGEEEEI
mmetsp:Transcript_21086/g.52430  ORF Transcript_21086/g.52430 Transcript_21086/m.52430 type:complete len:127 (+) Transcript_21086:113-493(+)